MEHRGIPSLEVGILNRDRVRFRLQGNFLLDGKYLQLAGEAEAAMQNGTIRISEGTQVLAQGDTLVLEPGDPGACRFLLRDVVIGVGFHWEQKEDQEFRGSLKFMVSRGSLQVVNVISLEEYLVSVISSEMRGESSPELLKAHTIISRSWLMAQIEKQRSLAVQPAQQSLQKNAGSSASPDRDGEEEMIRWYDREDHDDFHVCADDHCQRYQGMTRAVQPQVEQAVRETTGQVLVWKGVICDARYSKCCGGVSETFESCWEPVKHPYLQRVDDNPPDAPVNTEDLTLETNAEAFIRDSPVAFCNTADPDLLSQVLNDYDQVSADFYRWEVRYAQQELAALIRKKSGMDFGHILDLVPVERGVSSRLIKLRIVGTLREVVIGKELEIRRWLSPSHLYSSAFVVEKGTRSRGIPESFTLRGAGWGHGVGLCQIGAAVMAHRGYHHLQILQHYFIGTNLEKRYA